MSLKGNVPGDKDLGKQGHTRIDRKDTQTPAQIDEEKPMDLLRSFEV